MKKLKRIIFLHSIFSERALIKSKAISAAANLWQLNFLKQIKSQKIQIICAGYLHQQLWPKGKLFVQFSKKDHVSNFKIKKFNYINFFFFKEIYLSLLYLKYLMSFPFQKGDLIMIYNKSFLSKIVRLVSFFKKIPWVFIVADSKCSEKPSGYIYLSWDFFLKNKNEENLFLDGGVLNLKNIKNEKKNSKKKIILYSGTIEGNRYLLSNLLKAFSLITDKNINLWICGKGKSKELSKALNKDKRIFYFGFVKINKLINLCQKADIFVNPRNISNNVNTFPSKILFYLNFCKPIISTKVGLNPKYNNILFKLKNDKPHTLKRELIKTLKLNNKSLIKIKKEIKNFNKQNSWKSKSKKFINWINDRII